MSIHHVKYLFDRSGLASSSAARQFAKSIANGAFCSPPRKSFRPYHRPPLSKEYLRREKSRDELFTHDQDWFEKNHVELRTGRRAAHLDVARAPSRWTRAKRLRMTGF